MGQSEEKGGKVNDKNEVQNALKTLEKKHQVLELQNKNLMNEIDEISCDHKEKLHVMAHNHLQLETEKSHLAIL